MAQLAGGDKTSAANRRAYPRSPVVVRQAKMRDGREVFFGYASNISTSGLFVSSPKPRKPDEVFDIEFTLPGVLDKRFSCKCRVVWSRSYKSEAPYPAGFGVEFIGLSEEDRKYLKSWVDRVPAKD